MVRVGVIGLGFMGYNTAKTIHELNGCEITAACDTNATMVAQFCEEIGAQGFSDYNAMFASGAIDAVYNCTPDALHKPIALAAFKAGIHVFSEKPLAENSPNADEMAAAAQKSALVNMVNFTYRNSSALYQVKELVEAGELGEIVHVEGHYLQDWLSNGSWKEEDAFQWRLASEYGSLGTLGDTGVHALDFATFPVGKITSLQCKLHTFENLKGKTFGKYTLDANDSALVSVQFENGALGTIHATRWATGKANSVGLEIYGTKGAVKIDLDNGYDQYEICEAPTAKDWRNSNFYTVRTKTLPIVAQRFVQAIAAKKTDFEPDFARGAEIQKLLDLCLESDKQQRWLDVK